MSRPVREQDLRVKGLSLAARFTLSMSIGLAVVMVVAGVLLVSTSKKMTLGVLERRIADSLRLSVLELQSNNFRQVDERVTEFAQAGVLRANIVYGLRSGREIPAYLYEYRDSGEVIAGRRLLVPKAQDETGQGLVGLIAGITLAVILAGALLALMVASQVSKPLEAIVGDIRQIARGDLRRRSRVSGGGEIELLARAVNRMAEGLEEAQEVQIELSVREREMEVAEEVREALHPDTVPSIPGFDLAARHIGSPQPGGDFHDFIELPDGRVGLLVCGVSGQGVPGALVGATARSYLRSGLVRAEPLEATLFEINRFLARDVRRGMYVTAMYVLLDAKTATAEVACAGHKVPLLRIGADGKLRAVHPEGIALGFDKGPVFERALKVQQLSIEPGERLVLFNTGAAAVLDEEGQELGEKAFYRLVLRSAGVDSEAMLEALEEALYEHAGEEPLPSDISIVTVARTA